MTVEIGILILGILLLAAVFSSKLADRFGVPALLFFLGVGMLAGSEGIGGVEFDSPQIMQAIGSSALMVILFAGGLETSWKNVRPVLAQGVVLSTVGVLVPMLLLASFAWFMLGTYTTFELGTGGLSWTEALLLAAIVSSTDAAAVFSVFRTSKIQPRPHLRSILELESGSNDPMAILLTTTIIGVIMGTSGSVPSIIGGLLIQILFGGIVGGIVGWLGMKLINRMTLSANGLYPILALAFGCLAFGLSDVSGGNSYLSVYIAGLVLGNGIKKRKTEILSFHDGLDSLMQIVMFIMLGLLVYPSQLLPVAGVSITIALFLMFVARPLSVFLCLSPFKMKKNEKLYISWVGLRGSVPIMLATLPAMYGLEDAAMIFNVIFFIVLTSVFIQGLTLVPAAKWLKVTKD
ncbi:potassium/proton antiporter [Lentisphaera profundi]|uniref:Potassium/proton antiporter n=1 Tax=Lentisphaera profundi TaxID=1658616 RepID=A0ABY7VWP0_9BACT|nr:potassium/proton antiporter [Lentisphaera profundi]WDE98643.1 potassium/proton antiporter [Lentisphaera profundi]